MTEIGINLPFGLMNQSSKKGYNTLYENNFKRLI